MATKESDTLDMLVTGLAQLPIKLSQIGTYDYKQDRTTDTNRVLYGRCNENGDIGNSFTNRTIECGGRRAYMIWQIRSQWQQRVRVSEDPVVLRPPFDISKQTTVQFSDWSQLSDSQVYCLLPFHCAGNDLAFKSWHDSQCADAPPTGSKLKSSPSKTTIKANASFLQCFGVLPSTDRRSRISSHPGGEQHMSEFEIPYYLLQPSIKDDRMSEGGVDYSTTPDLTASFISHQRRLISGGRSSKSVLGSNLVDMDTVFGQVSPTIHPATVSQWIAHLVHPFDMLGVPEKLGLMLLGGLLLRWRIEPLFEAYASLPSFMRPTPTQVSLPHETWIDFIPWPDVRDAFILEPNLYANLAHYAPEASGFISVNWRQSPAHLIECALDGTLTLSTGFKEHVCKLDNWSVEREASVICPILGLKIL